MDLESELAYAMREVSGLTGDFYFYWKGRVALYRILQSQHIGPGDEVILPAYTCVVVPNAIQYLGAVPKYVDIDIATYSVTSEAVKHALSEKTKAVICQNTYGLSHEVDSISALCQQHGIFSIEDCTHGFSGTYKSRPNGSWCDAAFFSSQWNKPFSSGLGGYAYFDNSRNQNTFLSCDLAEPLPSLRDQLMLTILLRVRPLINNNTYYLFQEAYRFLSKHNLVTGSSKGEELASTEMPKSYVNRMCAVQFRAAIRAVRELPKLNLRRLANGTIYTSLLIQMGKNHIAPELHDDHLFLKYPLLVQDRDSFMVRAREAKIPFGDWFCSPLHPVTENLSRWNFDSAKYPNAVFASQHVVNIPTDTKKPEKILSFLEKNRDLIL